MGKTADERESFDAMMRETFGAPPAVRQLDASLIRDPGFQRRYPAETGVLRGLDEPWVAVTTSFVVDGAGRIVATVRPQISGPSVAALLQRNPRGLDAQTSAAIAMDVLSALSALHARGVAHRGELVEHVIVGGDGTCVLVDEGLAPRWPDQSTQAAVAADLRSFADLVARCLGGRPRSHRGRPAAPRMHRTASGWIPRPAHDLLRPLATRAAALPTPNADTAAALLTELGMAAARAFEPEWDMRARERLAQASLTFATAPPPPPPPPASSAAPPRSQQSPASIWPLPRPIRLAVVAAAIIGATASFLIAVLQAGSNPVTPSPATTPQANPLPAMPATVNPSATAASPSTDTPSLATSRAPVPSASTTNPGAAPVSTPPPSAVQTTPSSTVTNAGFESGSLEGWSCSGTDSVVTSPVHSGAYALQGAANNSDNAQCSQSIAVAPNTSYTLSAWVNGAYVFIGATGTGTKDVDTWTQGTNGTYTKLSFSFTTGPSTSTVTVYVHGWYAQGTYYADDVSLVSTTAEFWLCP